MQETNNSGKATKSIKFNIERYEVVLCIFYILSFVVYFFELNQVLLVSPLVYLSLVSIRQLILIKFNLTTVSKILLSRRLIWCLTLLPILSLIGFMISSDTKAENIFNFSGIYIIGISSIIFLIKSQKNFLLIILRSFYYSAIVSIIVYFALNGQEMIVSLASNIRFSGENSFHFNLIGYICAGFSGTFLYQILTRKHILLNIAFFCLSLIIILAAQSRGSFFAVVIGLCLISTLYLSKNFLNRRKNSSSKIMISMFLIVFILCIMLIYQDSVVEIYKGINSLFDQKLELSTSERGLNSGLTGRTDIWAEVLNHTDLRVSLFGNGFRTGSNIVDSVDNGYLTVLYENGVFWLLFLCASYFSLLIKFIRSYFLYDREKSLLCLTYIYIITVFLSNNFVARFLLSIGNPFSAFMIVLLFASPTLAQSLNKDLSQNHR